MIEQLFHSHHNVSKSYIEVMLEKLIGVTNIHVKDKGRAILIDDLTIDVCGYPNNYGQANVYYHDIYRNGILIYKVQIHLGTLLDLIIYKVITPIEEFMHL